MSGLPLEKLCRTCRVLLRRFSPNRRWSPRRQSLASTATVVVALAAFASACFHASFDLTIDDDGSGSMRGAIQIERTVTQLALDVNEDIGLTFEDFCAVMEVDTFGSDAPRRPSDSYVFESELVVDDAGCEATFASKWTADHENPEWTGLGPDGGPLLQRSDGGWRFELSMDVVREMFNLDRNADLFTLVVDQPTLTVSVTLPGEVQEHNADARDGSTFRWHVVMSDIENMPDTLYAGAAPSGGSGAAILVGVVLAVVVAVLLIIAIAVLVRRRLTRAAHPTGTEPELG